MTVPQHNRNLPFLAEVFLSLGFLCLLDVGQLVLDFCFDYCAVGFWLHCFEKLGGGLPQLCLGILSDSLLRSHLRVSWTVYED